MKIRIDDANVTKIKEIYEFYPVDGVTTNPSIVLTIWVRMVLKLQKFFSSENVWILNIKK